MSLAPSATHSNPLGAQGKTADSKADKARLDEAKKRRAEAKKRREQQAAEDERIKKEEKKKMKDAAKAEKKAAKAEKKTGPGAVDSRIVKKMKPPQLKEALKERGQDIQGNKKTLIARLLKWNEEYMKENA